MAYNAIYIAVALLFGAMASWAIAAALHNRKMRIQIERDNAALRQAEHQVEQILMQLPIGIVVLNGGNREVLFSNPAGRELIMGRAPSSLPFLNENGQPLAAEDHPFGSGTAGSRPKLFGMIDINQRTRHYEISSIVISGKSSGAVEIIYMIKDETVRVETEQALERSHRLEALGSLTSGVAHDFNNMLTPIVGGLDIVRRDKALSETSAKAVDRALKATGRASTLVHRLLAFSRQQDLETHKINLSDLVQGAWNLFGRKLGPNVETFINVRRSVVVEIDPTQLELAMLNLMANARDAMPEGGELTVTVDEVNLADNDEGLAAGRYGRITVTDTGVGMKSDVLRRAVEPFFTTKEIGTGSGLGLSMVDGFAAQSGGNLNIKSAPGQGTRIDILLPALDMDVSEVIEQEETFTPTQAATILLVDDEDLVRTATAAMLSDLGHSVIEASSGSEAITILRRGEKVEAIVADHLMPGMTGGAMAHEIWDFDADMPILLVSGYNKTDALPTDMPKLAKPFRRNDLAKAVEALLTTPKADEPQPQ